MRRFLRAAFFVWAIMAAANELRTAAIAEQLTAAVPHRELDEIEDVWDRYDALKARSLDMGLAGLKNALVQQTQILTDRVADDYKSPSPSVREAQWRMARVALARAVSASPGNARLRAALRYCDGHIHRINGEARKLRRQTVEAQHEFTEAVTSFREAAEFRPNWPDPFLGLTRTFIFGLDDIERGADALKEAQRLGYVASNRENAMLADGYKARAESLIRSSRRQVGTDREQDYLTRAADAYRQAIGLYSGLLGFADADRNLRVSRRGLQWIEGRLADLAHPSTPPAESLVRWP
jgi:hypothetical protein